MCCGATRNDDARRLEPRDLFALALRLRGLGVLRAEALDESIELRDLLFELLVVSFEALAPQFLLLEITGELHGVVVQPAAIQLLDVGGHAIEEHAIVGHHHQPAVEVLEIIFEPLHRRQVEMVGGLIEEQQGRVGEQQGRERGAHAPAARELRQRPVLIGEREAQPREHASRTRLDRVFVVDLQMMLQLSGALQQIAELGILGRDAAEPLMELVQLLAHPQHFAVRLERALEHGAVVALGGLLRQVAEPRPPGHHALALFIRQLAQHDAQQRGLAGAVGTHQGAAVPGREHPVEFVEQHALSDRVAELLQLNQVWLPGDFDRLRTRTA